MRKTQLAPLVYPVTAKTNHVDVYHGVQIADPYRWLEDDHAEATKDWVEAQNRVTFGWLEDIPEREAIRQRLTGLWDYERYGVPFREGGRYFFSKNDGLQNQSVLYTMESLDEEPRVLLDPNTLSEDGTVALRSYAVSDDGNHLAYGLSTAGSDWQEWKVRDVQTGEDLDDHLQWVKFSGASWTPDGRGFYYSRYDEPEENDRLKGVNYFQKLHYHRLGTPQSEDERVYHRPDEKEWGFDGHVTEDGAYLIISVWQGTDTRNRVFYRELGRETAEVVELLNDFDAAYSFIGNVGTRFYFRTDLDAPRGRILAIDVTRPAREEWSEIIPQTADRLQGANLVNDQLVAFYLKDARSEVKVFDRDGSPVRVVDLPGIGSAGGFRGKRHDTDTFYSFTGYTSPTTIYRYDLTTGQSTVFRRPEVDFNPDEYETRQEFYQSKDGTRVPMFITSRKGLERNGNNPTYLYGYGGFDISITPSFSVSSLVWMEMGGVLAVANLRGGGEYGEEWHQAGMKLKKQNVFDDFIAAAEWLIDKDYTRPERLAIGGGSNGGLLVGACMTQRPELFAAALPAVGVMDMLRFHKFTIGWAWTSEYGSSDRPDEFQALHAYSPLHNLKPRVRYPSTLITTADHDDRVVPAHSFKFAATLQEAHAGSNPVLIRIETKAGHGAGKPTAKIIEEAADRWAFLVRELDMKPRLTISSH
ncbi:MAG TPA: prolyl oligopeptidase family serine peptidase [Methylomirabilota bacterium]|nr:prolyl oligopeptidase family serine peptidase [Methylomirabilota bacterium]